MNKRLLISLISIVLIVSIFTSCGGTVEPPTNEEPNSDYLDVIGLEYTLICDAQDFASLSFTSSFVSEASKRTGYAIGKKPESTPERDYEFIVGNVGTRPDSSEIFAEMTSLCEARLGVGIIKVKESKIYVCASDGGAAALVCNELLKYEKNGKLEIPRELDFCVIYDRLIYSVSGEFVFYEKSEINSLPILEKITVNGMSIPNFDPSVKTYLCATNYVKGYPEISASAGISGSSVSVIPASAENGGCATITVTSPNGSKTDTYTVKVTMEIFYNSPAEIVNKGGKLGVVSFVIDDGDHGTANFIANTIIPKYSSFRGSFALITDRLATPVIDTDADGNTYYKKDDEGKYLYVENTDEVNYWRNILSEPRLDALSHSHTHKYWGEDDEGGIYTYRDNSGNILTSSPFPKGNSTFEVFGSNQFIRELLDQRGLVFIHPGVGVPLKDYYDFYMEIMKTGEVYIGARLTINKPTDPKAMLNSAEEIANLDNRYATKAYMIQHYNTDGTTTKDSSIEACQSADIKYWRDYIDSAKENGDWACFCIHVIKEDASTSRSGHYIYQSQADALFGYADSLSDELWIASYTDAAIYYNQWSTATVDAKTYLDEYVTLSLTLGEASQIYDMEMTVKVSIPNDWNSAKVGERELEILEDDSGKYVLADIAPGESITINQ